MLDQGRQFLDLDGERLRRRQRLVEHRIDLGLHGAELAAELGELARQVGRAARDGGDLVAHLGAVAGAGGDRVIDRKRGQDAEPDQERFGAGQAEAQIDHKADRAGDKHHADSDEDGADTHHAEPRYASRRTVQPRGAHAGPARMIRIRAVAVSTSAAAPQVRSPPWLSFWCAFITAGKRRTAADAAFGTGAKAHVGDAANA